MLLHKLHVASYEASFASHYWYYKPYTMIRRLNFIKITKKYIIVLFLAKIYTASKHREKNDTLSHATARLPVEDTSPTTQGGFAPWPCSSVSY